MEPRLFTLLSVLSLILALAIALLWIRSYFHLDQIGYHKQYSHKYSRQWTCLTSAHGRIYFEQGIFEFLYEPMSRPGFYYFTLATRDSSDRPFTRSIPHWLVLLLFASPRFLHFALHKRLAPTPGLCTTCHYDLRASKDRCPECGTPIDPAKLEYQSTKLETNPNSK